MFAFALKNKEGSIQSWYIDLKEKGVVGKGEAPEGKKPDGESSPYGNMARFRNLNFSAFFILLHAQ